MPNSKRYSLGTAVRQKIEELQAEGHMTVTRLIDGVTKDHPKLCKEAGKRAIRELIAKMARDAMKREAEVWKGGQDVLPLEISSIRLPHSISLPPEEGGRDMEWERIEDATFRQLSAYAEFLGKQVSFDIARYREMRRLEAILRPHMAENHEDEAIGPWLRMLREQAA